MVKTVERQFPFYKVLFSAGESSYPPLTSRTSAAKVQVKEQSLSRSYDNTHIICSYIYYIHHML